LGVEASVSANDDKIVFCRTDLGECELVSDIVDGLRVNKLANSRSLKAFGIQFA